MDDASTTSAWAAPRKKEHKQENISKRNLPNLGIDGWMDGWMEVLADQVHKQEEHVHIPQHCYIHFTQPSLHK